MIEVGQRWVPYDDHRGAVRAVIVETVGGQDDDDELAVREDHVARLWKPMRVYQLRRDYRRATNPEHN